MSNPANGEQSKTVVEACCRAAVEGRLREFARHPHPDFTTTAQKLPKLFISSREPHHWKGKNSDQAQSAPTTLEKFRLHTVRL
jgi:hypothetical protein